MLKVKSNKVCKTYLTAVSIIAAVVIAILAFNLYSRPVVVEYDDLMYGEVGKDKALAGETIYARKQPWQIKWRASSGSTVTLKEAQEDKLLSNFRFALQERGFPGTGPTFNSVQGDLYSIENKYVGRLTTWFDEEHFEDFATTGRGWLIEHHEFELPNGILKTVDFRPYVAIIDAPLRPGSTMVIAVSGEGRLNGGTGRFKGAKGIIKLGGRVYLDENGGILWFDDCTFVIEIL